jgi:GTP cyclohydrolase III
MKVLELLRPQWHRPIRDRIDASVPLQLSSAPSVSLTPALCDAQEALQEAETKRRKEDLAVEESVKEVLAWAQVHRPKNTTKTYLPKQREWKVSSPL